MVDFAYEPLTDFGEDDTEYELLTSDFVGVEEFHGEDVLVVEPEGLRLLAERSMHDASFFLRESHNASVAAILSDPEASENDLYVARTMLENAVVAAEGRLPLCQDTGTATIVAKKGARVFTSGGDEEALTRGVFDTYTTDNLRYSQTAPLTLYEEKNTGSNLPAQIDVYAAEGDEYEFLFIAKGGGSANKTSLYQETKALLTPETLLPFLVEKMRSLGTAACPPYHIGFVIGGTSADWALKMVKLATAGYCDNMPTTGSATGRAFRDLELERQLLAESRQVGLGAQFGGPSFAHDVRVIRGPRHGASCPVGMAVSCSAHRNVKAKIDRRGLWIEKLDRNPARWLEAATASRGEEATDEGPIAIDLDQPMDAILAELTQYPVKTRLSLTGTMVVGRDIAHAKIKERIDAGEGIPEYLKDHPIYYAGPAKTPEGHGLRLLRPHDRGAHGLLRRPLPVARRLEGHDRQGQPLPGGHRRVPEARRLLPRLDRRPGRRAGQGQHHQGGGPRVSRAGNGGCLEDRGEGLPGVHPRGRQGQRLLPSSLARRHTRRRREQGRPGF